VNFKTLSSKTVFKARVFKLREDEVLYPDGRQATFHIVEHNGAVAMVPVDPQGRVLLVRQFRQTTGKLLLELPAGTLEDGEDPESCAYRELCEEVGMAPGNLQKIGEFFLAPGYSSEVMHIYLATDLREEKQAGDEDEFLSVEAYTPEELFAMIDTREIEDAKTITGLLLARSQLGKYP